MSTWHTAHIKFQYSAKSDLNHRVFTSVTIQVNDKKYGAVMAELRTKFPSCTNFVIIEIDWEAWLRSMIGSTAKPTLELPNQLTGMYSIPVSANPIKLMLVVLVAFEKSLWSRRMLPFLPLRTNRWVRFGFSGVYRARSLSWSVSVVLHDSWWWLWCFGVIVQ